MEEDNNVSITGLIKNLFLSSFKLVTDSVNLFFMEAHLAGKSLKALLVFAIIQIALLTTTWLGLNAMLVCFLASIKISWLVALSLDCLLNILIMVLVALHMLRLKSNITFPATRRQLVRDRSEK